MNDDLSLAVVASKAGTLAQSISPAALLEAAATRRFSVEFHPVVGNDDALLAWRAKARFTDAQGVRLSPRAVFAALHANPALLLATELQLKSLALAHAPATGELLLPLDADSYAAAGPYSAGNAFDQLFCEHPRAIVEICENQPMVDVARLHRLLHRLAESGTPLAMSRQTPIAACLGESLYDADWLRIPCPPDLRDPRHVRHVRALEAIAESARQMGSTAFVSNVCDAATLAVIRAIGFAGACGPVFEARMLASPDALPYDATRQVALRPRVPRMEPAVRQAGSRS